jgi:predicted amidophosphoribosyltransferase
VEKFKKNIENIARKPIKEEQREEDTACPFCTKHFSEFELSCPHCSLNVPFCIATGK